LKKTGFQKKKGTNPHLRKIQNTIRAQTNNKEYKDLKEDVVVKNKKIDSVRYHSKVSNFI
jgi:hypothetical protein